MYIYKDVSADLYLKTWIEGEVGPKTPNLPSFEAYIEFYGLRKAQIFTLHESKEGGVVAEFSLSTLAGNHGILVLHGQETIPYYRNRGYGKVCVQQAIEISNKLNCSMLIATTLENNEYENKILRKNRFLENLIFRNRKTSNNCYLWTLKLI